MSHREKEQRRRMCRKLALLSDPISQGENPNWQSSPQGLLERHHLVLENRNNHYRMGGPVSLAPATQIEWEPSWSEADIDQGVVNSFRHANLSAAGASLIRTSVRLASRAAPDHGSQEHLCVTATESRRLSRARRDCRLYPPQVQSDAAARSSPRATLSGRRAR